MATFNVTDEIDRLLYEAFSFDEDSQLTRPMYGYYDELAHSGKPEHATAYWLSTMMYGFHVADGGIFEIFTCNESALLLFDIADALLDAGCEEGAVANDRS